MTSIKIDFAEEVSVDTILTPVFDKEQKCIGGLLYDGKNRKKEICSGTGDDFSGSGLYPAALFCAKGFVSAYFWPNLRFQDDAGRLCFGVSDL